MKSRRVDGSAITLARELAGYSQPGLAKKLGVDQSAISHWERGEKQPSAENFKNLCRALKSKPIDLFMAVSDDKAA